ncbi:MAG: thermonuclease family protein [Elusimicrobiales bacterium]|nr:thermonuclease family protein [Elusimicrobiales bacterium]
MRIIYSGSRILCFCGLMFAAVLSGAAASSEALKVLYVIDGDTIKVLMAGNKESIRLIGIDTPESKANKKARKDAARSGSDLKAIVGLGKAAAAFTKSLVKPGDLITIEQDVQPRDRYGRILAYVYLKSGKMLNEEIIAAGYASVMTIPPNVRYQERFLSSYRAARQRAVGLWAVPR